VLNTLTKEVLLAIQHNSCVPYSINLQKVKSLVSECKLVFIAARTMCGAELGQRALGFLMICSMRPALQLQTGLLAT
jgi:hypothetical protein